VSRRAGAREEAARGAEGEVVNVLELFAGAGGAAIGLKRAGMDHLLCVEWNEAACRTLEAAACARGE